MGVKNKFSFKLSEFLLVIYVLFAGIMLTFSSGSFVLNFKQLGFSALSTLGRGVHCVVYGIGSSFNAVRELAQLRKEYEILSEKLSDYEQMRRSNAEIKKENERLKEQLGFATSLEEKNYPARIIARDSDNLYAAITIDKGSLTGIKKNMPFIAYQNGNSGLVGKVIQVGAFTSQVMPIYNLNCTVSCRIQNTRDIGLVSGNGSDDAPLQMNYVRKRVLEDLHYGDVVVTSGENNNYMKDLAVGTISKISVVDYNSLLDIELTPIIDFSRLENVLVVNMHEINEAKK
ncbi:MAG: rod shape-determining protein MreC [Treponema sp.]|nr:rod shape-determining protein MreC [Treponema sp.]